MEFKLILQLDGCVTVTADQSIYVQQYQGMKLDEICIGMSGAPLLPLRPSVKAKRHGTASSLVNHVWQNHIYRCDCTVASRYRR